MPPDTKTEISIGTDAEGSPFHNDSLLPLWKDFAEVLRPLAMHDHVFLRLAFATIRLPMAVLEPALKTAPPGASLSIAVDK